MTKLTQDQATQLQRTIEIARGGRASLGELGAAHDLAASAGLPGCAAELRAHLRALASDQAAPHERAGQAVMLGIVSGLVTHLLVGGT